MFELVIFTEGTITLNEAWNLDRDDRDMIIETFEELAKARNPKGNNMKQEQM